MGFTTKLLLNTSRIKNDGTYPIITRVTFNRKILKIPTGHCVTLKDWDEKKQQIKSSSKVSNSITRLNHILKNYESQIYDEVAKLELNGQLDSMSPKELKQHLLGSSDHDKLTVYEHIDVLIEEKLAARKNSSALAYRGVKRKLFALLGDKLLRYDQIDYSTLKKLETTHLADGGGMGGFGVYMRTLRAIYNRAIKDNLVSADNYPFKDYKIKSVDTQRRALSESDFLKFKSLDLQRPLLQAQEYFMASFYMRGMNYIDLAFLKTSNIEGDFNRVRYMRNKTGKYFSIKISPALKTILQKYVSDLSHDTYIFPILSIDTPLEKHHETIKNKRKRLNQKFRKIADLFGFEPFTIYAARHTYATMGKRKGVPTAVIQESLGHKTEAITQTYLSSFDNSVVDEYDELIMGD